MTVWKGSVVMNLQRITTRVCSSPRLLGFFGSFGSLFSFPDTAALVHSCVCVLGLDGFWQLHAAVLRENTLKPNVHYLLCTEQQKGTDRLRSTEERLPAREEISPSRQSYKSECWMYTDQMDTITSSKEGCFPRVAGCVNKWESIIRTCVVTTLKCSFY